jgi:hypothetical protein
MMIQVLVSARNATRDSLANSCVSDDCDYNDYQSQTLISAFPMLNLSILLMYGGLCCRTFQFGAFMYTDGSFADFDKPRHETRAE